MKTFYSVFEQKHLLALFLLNPSHNCHAELHKQGIIDAFSILRKTL